MGSKKRKVIQISSYTGGGNSVYPFFAAISALCDDGTLWEYDHGGGWTELPEVPQPVDDEDEVIDLDADEEGQT